jgi:AAA15 family ATPase/GTPase
MLINFSVENFASIKEKQTLSFEATKSKDLEEYYIVEPIKGLRLLKMACIYGANASGKSNILKALDFLREMVESPLEKKIDKLRYQPFLLDNLTPKQNSIFIIEFIERDVKFYYEIEFNQKFIVREVLFSYKPKKALVFERKTNEAKQLATIKFGKNVVIDKNTKNVLESNILWNNTTIAGYLKTNVNIIELEKVAEWFSHKFYSLVSVRTDLRKFVSRNIEDSNIRKNSIVNILKKADINITDIIIDRKEEEILNDIEGQQDTKKVTLLNIEFQHKINEQTYYLPFALQSQGTQRYYGLAGLLSLMIDNPILLPIDELESSLHPDLLKHFILSFLQNAKNSQLVFTTHLRELLLDKDILRQDVIWFTEKNKDGATELFSLADFNSDVIRDTTSWYNAYKTGKLGAVPSLKDTYIEQQTNGEKK